MDTRVPARIQPLLTDYLAQIEQRLPNFLDAFYLHGSIALDAFNPRSSDIDFVAVLTRPAAEQELATLRDIHRTVANTYPRRVLEGIYLQQADLGDCGQTLAAYPAYHDGILELSTAVDQNCITWWILKNRGIALKGAPPQTLALTVDLGMLITGMKHNLNSYWVGFTNTPNRMLWLLGDFGIQWAVLGVLRQFYTFKEHDITSKTGAGEYALTQLPSRWHRIIREAIAIREETGTSRYRTKVGRAIDALQFLRYIIHLCNTLPD